MSTNKKSKDWYEVNAQKYTDNVRNPIKSAYHHYYEKPAMYDALPDLEGKAVLSIGCGSGEDIFYLKNQGASRAVGVDLSEKFIEIAKKDHPECEFHVMDMEHLDFEKGSFDFVYSSLAIHYIKDWASVFKEVYKVLKPGSCFIFSAHHPTRFAMDRSKDEQYEKLTLEIRKKIGTRERDVIGNYLSKRKIIDALGKDTVDTWSMPLSDISKDIKEAGFLIEEVIEPRPMNEIKEIDLGTFERLSKIPEFIIFKLIRN